MLWKKGKCIRSSQKRGNSEPLNRTAPMLRCTSKRQKPKRTDTNPELVIARKPEVRQKKYMVFINDKTIKPKPKSGKYKVNEVPNPLANNRANR